MGRFYKHTTSPVVDYSYDIPFTELWKALEYKQGRQDAALQKLSIAKDKLTNLEYIPGSSDEEYLKQKQAEYDALSEQVSGMDLSGNQAALNTAISDFADDPRLANVQRNATFYKEQQDRMQTLADSGMLDYNNLPDWLGQTDFGNNILSERVMGIVNPYDQADAYFKGVDKDAVARNPSILDNILSESLDVFKNSGVIQNYVKSKGGDPTKPDQRHAAAKEVLEAAKAKYLNKLGIDPNTGKPVTSGPTDDDMANIASAKLIIQAGKGDMATVNETTVAEALGWDLKDELDSLGKKTGSKVMQVNMANREAIAGEAQSINIIENLDSKNLIKVAEKFNIDAEGKTEEQLRKDVGGYIIAQKFYDSSIFRELEKAENEGYYANILSELDTEEGRRKNRERWKKEGKGKLWQSKEERKEGKKREEEGNLQKLQKLKEKNEEIAIRTGVAPLTFNADGTYTTNYPVNEKKYDPDGNVVSDSDYVNKLLNLDINGRIDVDISGGNNFVYKNGKPYIQGYYAFDEDKGDELFDPTSGVPSVIGWAGWTNELVEELGIVKRKGGNKAIDVLFNADDANMYEIPVLIPLSADEFDNLLERHDQDVMQLEGKETREQRRRRQDIRRDVVTSVGNDNILKGMSAIRDNTKEMVANHLEIQGINDWSATGAQGYNRKAELFMQNSGMAPATKNEINSFIKANTDADGKLNSSANPEQMSDFFTEVVLYQSRLNDYLSDPNISENKKERKKRDFSSNFVNRFNQITGRDITSATTDDIKSFGLSHTGGGTYKIDNINTFKSGVASWADSKGLLKIDNNIKGISFNSDITSAKDIYGSKVSSPYLSPKTAKALKDIGTLASSPEYGLKIGVNSMGRPPAVQNMLFDSAGHEAAKTSAHSQGNAIDFDVTSGSEEERVILMALDSSVGTTGYHAHYHDGHLHVEIT